MPILDVNYSDQIMGIHSINFDTLFHIGLLIITESTMVGWSIWLLGVQREQGLTPLVLGPWGDNTCISLHRFDIIRNRENLLKFMIDTDLSCVNTHDLKAVKYVAYRRWNILIT